MNPEPGNHWSDHPGALDQPVDYNRVDYPLEYYKRFGGFTEADAPSAKYLRELMQLIADGD